MVSKILFLPGKLLPGVCFLTFLALTSRSLPAQTAKFLIKSDFESPSETFNPWGGVNSTTNNIEVPVDIQYSVDDSGTIKATPFSPGVAVGDLNGDGLPDIVLADPRGHLWYYPNHGTPAQPKFTFAEVLPVWLGSADDRAMPHFRSYVPRVQLVDVDGDGKLDILVGTFDGRLYFLHNTGSAQLPVFTMPQELGDIEIPTSTESRPWCNYLSPFLTNWYKNGISYLIMGDGTYSANSIYMLKNVGDSGKLRFNETAKWKIIPGMGREDLSPQVVDWNGDGKPDIICGERSGFIDLFLNKSGPDDMPPVFDEGAHIKIAGKENFGPYVVPCVADLNNSKVPSLIIANNKGTIDYARNTGDPGNMSFASPAAIKGVNPYPNIFTAKDWGLAVPFGDAYNLLVVTNATVEPGFTPPADHVGKNALKAYVYPFNNTYFKTRYFVPDNKEVSTGNYPDEFIVGYANKFDLKESQQYEISFNVKTDGNVTDMRSVFDTAENDPKGTGHVDISVVKPFSAGNSWSKVTDTVTWSSHYNNRGASSSFKFSIHWQGQGTVYLDDITLKSAQ